MFERTWESISKMRLSGGVVGKSSHVLIFMVIAMATIVAFVRTEFIGIVVALLISGVVLVVLWRLINFADRHPQAAILDGAEFLRHECLLASKDNPCIVTNPEDYTEARPISASENRKALMQPDVPTNEQPRLPSSEGRESDE